MQLLPGKILSPKENFYTKSDMSQKDNCRCNMRLFYL